ncbi:MAG: quinone-dependent dihydroorotate dehydrogenase [Alphaproteobacteria bacterium]|nr:quinone-dependent dihydroorotate dehydrogenase [Alphaproteobacteria bacterium]
MEFYRWAIRPILFRLDPEWIHRATVVACRTLGRSKVFLSALERFAAVDPQLRARVAGLDFPAPVGLAAGFDKNGEAVDLMSRLGFGFIEVGSVSEHPSAGNPGRPRIWRLTADEGLRVHYGCPNDGAVTVAGRLRAHRLAVPLGVNLVETNTGTVTSPEHAADELGVAVGRFIGIADYIVLNLSCPNMPRGGGLFDAPVKLAYLLQACARHDGLPPVFLKLTPSGDPGNPRVIDAILEAVDPFGFVKGFILNIPNPRPHATLRTSAAEIDRTRGGITGPSLLEPTKAVIRAWYPRIDRTRHALIGVGGIARAEDAYEMIRLGASLVQLCTALVYRGPGVVKRINDGLCRLLERDGFRDIGEAVGTGNGRRAIFEPAPIVATER